MNDQLLPESSGRNALPDTPPDLDAVIATLAEPVIPALRQAASRLQPLTPAEIAAMERTAALRLQQLTAALRAQQTGLLERAAAERAVTDTIDLPQALRDSVARSRGTATPGAAS